MEKKRLYTTIVILLGFVVVATCWSQSAMNSYQMKRMAYSSEIDAKIAFYQKRLYLIDSENPVLANIGKLAAQKVHFLKAYKAKLVDEMMVADVPLRTPKMKFFLYKKMKNIDRSVEGYAAK